MKSENRPVKGYSKPGLETWNKNCLLYTSQSLFIIFNHAGSVTGSLIRIAFLWVEVLLIFFAHLGMPVIGQYDSQKHVQNKCQNNKYQISQFKPQSLFQCDSSSSASFRMRL